MKTIGKQEPGIQEAEMLQQMPREEAVSEKCILSPICWRFPHSPPLWGTQSACMNSEGEAFSGRELGAKISGFIWKEAAHTFRWNVNRKSAG